MSTISDMAMTIEELRKCASDISSAADWLAEAFSANEAPKEEPVLKLEDIRKDLADASRAGHTAEIRALLQKYGADKLSQIDPANYKALLADVEVLKDAT